MNQTKLYLLFKLINPDSSISLNLASIWDPYISILFYFIKYIISKPMTKKKKIVVHLLSVCTTFLLPEIIFPQIFMTDFLFKFQI